MSLGQSMNITLGSMKNYQYALTVVSQNIANLDVEGYQRQRVNFQTNQYTTNCENVISTIKGMNGASISSLSDYVDDGLFNSMLDSKSEAEYYNTLANALGDLEGIADDLGENGLNALLNDFFSVAANLEQFPTDMTIRTQYVMAAEAICDKFNEISQKYTNVQEDKFETVTNEVNVINRLLADLATANEANVKNNGGSATEANIASILEDLSKYTNVTTSKNDNGSYNFYIGNVSVVEGNQVKYTLNAEFDANSTDNVVKFSLQSTENKDYVIENGVNDAFTSGSMKAYVEFLNGTNENFSNVSDMKANLNSAALAFVNALNGIQTYDNGDVFAASLTTDVDGNIILEKATTQMFVSADGQPMSAENIKVNSEIIKNPFLISAARINLNNFKNEDGSIDGNWVKAIGNSDNAVEISALQNAKICSYGGGTNNCTLSDFLINNAAKNGLDASSIQDKADTYNDIAQSDATNFANLIGVNLDEELADMIKYQRSYEASARLFSTINDLYGTIINMV